MTLILVRGIPGSGKSTFAEGVKYDEGYIHLEADMYFIRDDGTYRWDPSKVKEAHQWCQDTTRILLNNDYDVVVSNTFTRLWEMRPYLEMTNDVHVVRMLGQYGNIHNVPEEKVKEMKDRFEDYDGEHYEGNGYSFDFYANLRCDELMWE